MSEKLVNILIVTTCVLLLITMATCVAVKMNELNKPLEPASVCEYKVRFLSTAQYKTLGDFWEAVGHTVTHLKENGYEVLDLVPKYGSDMTQKEVLKKSEETIWQIMMLRKST